MFIKKIGLLIFTYILCVQLATGQATSNAEKVEAINSYIHFTNESTHGLLIVHRMLENFNKNINKFVDLPDQQINFYSNKDLPQDIFADPEDWFYETSPNEWYTKLATEKGKLPLATYDKLYASATEMNKITNVINKMRFDLEEQIKTLDLTKRENLSLVYDKLEEGVKLYKDFYVWQQKLEADVASYYKTLIFTTNDLEFPEVLSTVDNVYSSTRIALNALYKKDDDNFGEIIKNEESALSKFNAIKLTDYNSTRLINSKVQMYWNNIIRQTTESIKAQKDFYESENIPEDFKLYDKYYYYYNISVINKFNRYGNGVVFEMNRILEYLDVPVLRKFEMPHYFKVIYPEILIKDRYVPSPNYTG